MDTKSIIAEIMNTSLKLSQEMERLKGLFIKSGIAVTGDMKIDGINGDHNGVLKKLMDNLTEMPVIKIAAKQIIRKAGVTI